jgi:hypothetical protein
MSKIEKKPTDSGRTEKKLEFGKEVAAVNLELILFNSTKINEGNNGIIKSIRVEDMGEAMISYLESLHPGFSKREDVAVKLIKIYSHGVGRHEFEMQQTSYDIMEKNSSSNLPLAKIPKPLFYAELTIASPILKEKLLADGLSNFDDKVEILIMDMIPGEDLATHLYRRVVKIVEDSPKYKNKSHLLDKPTDQMSISELHRIVGEVVGYSQPGGKHRSDEMNQFEAQMVKTDNVKKLISFLKNNDFTLKKEWLDKIENTIRALHQGGVFHRDLHERNVMLDPEHDDVYLLDFGSTIKINPSSSEDVYEDDINGRRPNDLSIISAWKEITTTKSEDMSLEIIKLGKELDSFAARIISRDKSIQTKIESEVAGGKQIDEVVDQKTAELTKDIGDTHWKIKLALIKLTARNNRQLAEAYLRRMEEDPLISLPYKKMISSLKTIINQ